MPHEAVERARRRYEKTNFYIIKGEPHLSGFLVIYKDKDRVKFGLIPKVFYVRYGINVFATYAGGMRWWFRTKDGVPEEVAEHMRNLFENDWCPLPLLDLNQIEWTY